MNYKHCCVIDKENFYVEFVLIENGEIQRYTLKNGETLIDCDLAPVFKEYANSVGFIKPKWNGTEWVEGATAEEIAVWEEVHPAHESTSAEPTQLDRIEAQTYYTAMCTDTLLPEESEGET